MIVPDEVLSSTGAKDRVTGQDAPGAIDPQLCDAVMVETEDVIEVKSRDALPQFVMVTV
jgi:hypothetical protein